jgi:hypothetical protein
MSEYETRGIEIRKLSKSVVLHYMQATQECHPGKEGMRLSKIFRECGFDWGEYKNSTSSNQQYWIVALVRELESEGLVERVSESGPWRLISKY